MYKMDLIDTLSLILPALAFISVFLILSINLYMKFRPNGRLKVNCWFCNQWAKIPREMENSWDCPSCEQYNGFTKDGDYNKLIPQQHDELMNKVVPSANVKDCRMTNNGLCNTCNNNQQLKVQQLAMFSPIDENNFDEEVQRYEKQLERAYRLCPQCEHVVKRTLDKQKSIVLELRLSTLRKQGLNLLDLNHSSSGISKTAKQTIFVTAIRYTTLVIAVVRLVDIFKKGDGGISLPSYIVPYTLLFRDISYLIYNNLNELFNNLQEIFIYNNALKYLPYNPNFVLLFTGLFLQSAILLFNTTILEFTKCLLWVVLFLNNLQLLHISNFVELIICSFVIICPSSKIKQTKTNSFNKKIEFCADELLNSTFKNNLFDISNNESLKLFNLSKNEMPAMPVFDKFNSTPCFNFSTTYRSGGSSNESISTKKSCLNDSINNYHYELKESPNKSSESDWFKGLSDLHLSTYPKKITGDEIPAAFRVSSPLRPKPVLSPPKLTNVTQSSWVAGGYWKPNNFLNNVGSFSNLSRSSSQSSGFGSQASNNIFNSLPSSRTNSVCGEFDRFSVLSEPVCCNPNLCQKVYPNLRPDQQIYICSQKKFAYPQNLLNSSNLFSNTPFASNNFRSFSPGSNFTTNFSTPYEKGSLLKKWRQNVGDVQF